MTTKELRNELDKIFIKNEYGKMNTDFKKFSPKNGMGFFPYCNGSLINPILEYVIPEKCILILGQDFGNEEYFKNLSRNEKSNRTFSNLTKLFDKNKEKVFLSNVFMGLRIDCEVTGKNPELFNVEYLISCRKFLEKQINLIRPKIIITLGEISSKFLNANFNSEKKKEKNIPHPSWWHVNLKKSEDELKDEILKFYVS